MSTTPAPDRTTDEDTRRALASRRTRTSLIVGAGIVLGVNAVFLAIAAVTSGGDASTATSPRVR